jgi:hypothetical protein
MPSYEMPVVVRMNKEELAAALGRPTSDPDVERLGGLNVVLHPIGDTAKVAAHPALAAAPGAGAALTALAQTLKPIEEKLFQRLRSNPALAKRFLVNPAATLDELELVDPSTKSQIQSHASKIAPAMTVKK